MFERIDGFLGRLVFRCLGLVASVIAISAAYATYQTLISLEGLKSLIALVMFGAGAAIAGYTARYCFSPKRTFGDFIQAIEGNDSEAAVSRPRKSN